MQSPVAKRLQKTAFISLGIYFLVYFITFYANYRLHPAGAGRWALAMAPLLPILWVAVLVGRYLRNERDEYARDLAARCLLWGLAGFFSVDMLEGYLRIYGWPGHFPPFMSFWVFFIFLISAKLTYKAQNKLADE